MTKQGEKTKTSSLFASENVSVFLLLSKIILKTERARGLKANRG